MSININQRRTLERWIATAWNGSQSSFTKSTNYAIDWIHRHQAKRWARVAVYWEGKLKELEKAPKNQKTVQQILDELRQLRKWADRAIWESIEWRKKIHEDMADSEKWKIQRKVARWQRLSHNAIVKINEMHGKYI